MKNKSNPLLIGIFVLAGLALGFGILVMLATDSLFTRTEKYVMYFEGNVDGLDVGSPVLYKGFRVGRVTDMRLVVDRGSGEATLPVYVALEPERLHYENGTGEESRGRDFHIESGLRAQLQRKSLITGQMVIMLVEAPDTDMKVRERRDGIPEIPTIPTLTQDVAETLRGLPLEQMLNDSHASLEAVRELLESGRIRKTLAAAEATLERADTLMADAGEPLSNLLTNLSKNSDEFSQVLAQAGKLSETLTPAAAELRNELPELLASWETSVSGLDSAREELTRTLRAVRATVEPGTPTHRKLNDAMEQVRDTAASLEELTDYLQRHPESLLKGKPEPRSRP